jgi:hypothetical protein
MTNKEIIIMLFSLIVGMILTFFLVKALDPYSAGFENGYKDGQLDYYNGKIKYEMVTHPSTTTWEKKK